MVVVPAAVVVRGRGGRGGGRGGRGRARHVRRAGQRRRRRRAAHRAVLLPLQHLLPLKQYAKLRLDDPRFNVQFHFIAERAIYIHEGFSRSFITV